LAEAKRLDTTERDYGQSRSNEHGPAPTASRISAEERHRRIETAAYYYSLRRAGGQGQASDDWVQAEADVDLDLAKTAAGGPKAFEP
jgi:hypothetical protein